MTPRLGCQIITWNVYGKDPPDSVHELDDLLGLPESEYSMDLIIVGIQEAPLGFAALLPSSIAENPWTTQLKKALYRHSFVLMSNVQLYGILLNVFVQKNHLPFVSQVETSYTRHSFMSLKGSVTCRLKLYHVTCCFINSHFEAHPGEYQLRQRIMSYAETIEQQKFLHSTNVLDHDYVFWLGDLNFRLDLSSDEVLSSISEIDFASLWPHDQLIKAKCENLCFGSFDEAPLFFPPSYKFLVDSPDTYASSRVASWCDRILWTVDENAFPECRLSVNPLEYKSLTRYKISDHKPVVGVYNISVVVAPLHRIVDFLAIPPLPRRLDLPLICKYSVVRSFSPSRRDFIILCKKHFQSLSDYVYFVYADPTRTELIHDEEQVFVVSFPSDIVSDLASGFYTILYISEQGDVLAASDNFLVGERDDSSSSSTSSDDGDRERSDQQIDDESDSSVDCISEISDPISRPDSRLSYSHDDIGGGLRNNQISSSHMVRPKTSYGRRQESAPDVPKVDNAADDDDEVKYLSSDDDEEEVCYDFVENGSDEDEPDDASQNTS